MESFQVSCITVILSGCGYQLIINGDKVCNGVPNDHSVVTRFSGAYQLVIGAVYRMIAQWLQSLKVLTSWFLIMTKFGAVYRIITLEWLDIVDVHCFMRKTISFVKTLSYVDLKSFMPNAALNVIKFGP